MSRADVIVSTLTTVAVFLPIVFVEGIAGQLFRDQALTVTFALVFSLIVAITLVPMILAVLAAHFMKSINILTLLGTITGSMTSTPGLAATDSMTDSNAPAIAYATVYPVAMVILVICVQLLGVI